MPHTRKDTAIGGFTLVELIVVIVILSILAGIAALLYRQAHVSQYDEEALATLSDMYMQSDSLIASWGIGANANYEIPPGCLGLNPQDAGTPDGPDEMRASVPNWEKLGLIVPGIHHWTYQVCFGHFSNGTIGADATEGFLIVAHREVNGNDRFIVYGSGLESPIVNASSIPGFAMLDNAGMANFAYTSKLQPTP